uniref:Uncharacterized protein n=1 Tax=Knipowitschia caucasica TaxID=637954 RepID=A0AAV2LY38_KNICA
MSLTHVFVEEVLSSPLNSSFSVSPLSCFGLSVKAHPSLPLRPAQLLSCPLQYETTVPPPSTTPLTHTETPGCPPMCCSRNHSLDPGPRHMGDRAEGMPRHVLHSWGAARVAKLFATQSHSLSVLRLSSVRAGHALLVVHAGGTGSPSAPDGCPTGLSGKRKPAERTPGEKKTSERSDLATLGW